MICGLPAKLRHALKLTGSRPPRLPCVMPFSRQAVLLAAASRALRRRTRRGGAAGAGCRHAAHLAREGAAARAPPASRSSAPPAPPATASTARAHRRASSASRCRCPTATTSPTSPIAPPTPWSRSATGWPWPSAAGPSAGSIATCRRSATRSSDEQIERAVKYIWTFCTDPAWPRGDLNLPRAFFTEKAFPENETVWTTGVTGSGAKAVDERAASTSIASARAAQYEVKVPFGVAAGDAGGPWSRGLGDVEVAVRHTFYASYDRGSIFAAGGAVVLPTGKESAGPRQRLHDLRAVRDVRADARRERFLQVHTGYEIRRPTSSAARTRRFVRTALGYTIAQDQGLGRAWSPMAEVIVRQAQGRRHGVGRRAADAGLAQQAAAHPAERRRPRAAQRARRTASRSCSPTSCGTGSTAACSSSGSRRGARSTMTIRPTPAAGLRAPGCCRCSPIAPARAATRSRAAPAGARTRTSTCRSSRTPRTAWPATTTS